MLSETKKTGNIGELSIAADLVSKDFDVFFPFGDVSHIDLIAVKGSRILRIQVKTVDRVKDNGCVVIGHLTNRASGIRYTPDSIDYMALYVIQEKLIAYVPIKEFEGLVSGLSLRVQEAKNGQHKGTRSFTDFSIPS